MNLLLELASQVDPLTAGLLLAFWGRWEAWSRTHRQEHEQLQARYPHEVTHG